MSISKKPGTFSSAVTDHDFLHGEFECFLKYYFVNSSDSANDTLIKLM